jgi:molecular chaperone DnaJ
MRTHYETFGIQREASTTQIKRAYRSLVKLCHPDLFAMASATSTEAETRMREINAGYTVLSNPHKRETCDSTLQASRYSEPKPQHCNKCGQLTLYWQTEKNRAVCEECRKM